MTFTDAITNPNVITRVNRHLCNFPDLPLPHLSKNLPVSSQIEQTNWLVELNRSIKSDVYKLLNRWLNHIYPFQPHNEAIILIQKNNPLTPLLFLWPKRLVCHLDQTFSLANYKTNGCVYTPVCLYGSEECRKMVAIRLWISIKKNRTDSVRGPPVCTLWINRAEIMTGSSEQKRNLWNCGECFMAADGGRDMEACIGFTGQWRLKSKS